MIKSISARRALTIAASIVTVSLFQGCDGGSSAPAPLPAANLPADAPKAPVDSKALMEKTKGVSNAAFDSTQNPALLKGNAPAK